MCIYLDLVSQRTSHIAHHSLYPRLAKYAAKAQNITIYQFKEKIYSDFLCHQLENPAAPFTLD